MNAPELLNLAAQFSAKGETETAIKLMKEAAAINPEHAATNINLYQIYRQQGNIILAKEFLLRFLNSPQTGFTLDAVPKAKAELAEIDKQMSQPPQAGNVK